MGLTHKKIVWMLLLCALPAMAEAADKKTVKAAPAEKVTSKNLPLHTTPEDTKKLEAILDKEEEALLDERGAAKKASSKAPVVIAEKHDETVPVVLSSEDLEQYDLSDEEGFIEKTLTKIRVTAIRWRDAVEIMFAFVIAVYVRKLYRLSREQQKILSHAIRSAEYAAASAKRSAEVCEALMHEHKKPDEAQGRLDLGL